MVQNNASSIVRAKMTQLDLALGRKDNLDVVPNVSLGYLRLTSCRAFDELFVEAVEKLSIQLSYT